MTEIDEAEVKKCCHFDNMRFGIAVKRLVKRHPDRGFTEQIKNLLTSIVDIAKNPEKYNTIKSDAYLDHFLGNNPSIDFSGKNQFYVLVFSESLSIHLIYILVKECRLAGTLRFLLRGNDCTKDNIVCAFDLFDDYNECSFAPIKPGC